MEFQGFGTEQVELLNLLAVCPEKNSGHFAWYLMLNLATYGPLVQALLDSHKKMSLLGKFLKTALLLLPNFSPSIQYLVPHLCAILRGLQRGCICSATRIADTPYPSTVGPFYWVEPASLDCWALS